MSGVDHLLADTVRAAIVVASTATCGKSRRGVAILDRTQGRVVAVAANGPPVPFVCEHTALCVATCRRIAVHAEQRALMIALNSGARARHLEIVHVKVDEAGQPVPSGGPSCVDCSKLLLDAGVYCVYLLHEGGVWRWYEAYTFHEMSLASQSLPRTVRW